MNDMGTYINEETPAPYFNEPIETQPVSSIPPVAPVQQRRFLPKLWHKIVFAILIVLVVLFTAAGTIGLYTYSVVNQLKAQSADLQVSAHATYDQFKAQNLPAAQDGVKTLAEKVKAMRATYTKLSFYNAIPVVHSYYQDGIHGFNAADAGLAAGLKSLEAITPYADVLGFKGQGTFTGGTAEDRLKLILETLQKVTPVLDNISANLNDMKSELAQIDPNRYPENFQGKPLRSYIHQAQDVSNGAATALTQFRPVLEQLPAVAGGDGKRRKYFILFQNNNELRPTGGFMTAYSIINVENGKVTPESSDDIYALDKKFKKKIPIPEILGKYLTTEKYFNIRDMNIYPDFKQSMDLFLSNYAGLPDADKSLDGVISVDTNVLVDLLKILGPVQVDTYGTFTAENSPKCDCPQIIYALSEIADRPTAFVRQDRKGILGPMMRQILTKAYTAPKTLWPQLFEAAWKNIQGRHVQMYFMDPNAQSAAETAGAAGRLQSDPKAQDFIAIIDANLGGAKSNLFTTTDIQQEVSVPANGQITKKLTLTYRNNRKGDNCNLEAGLLCLNAQLRDWNRIYVPKGSKLVNAQGYSDGTAKQYDEGDFTVIDGEFKLEPMSQSKIVVEYTVPYTDTTTYKLKMWKQAGVKDFPVLMDVNGGQDKLTLDKDIYYETKF